MPDLIAVSVHGLETVTVPKNTTLLTLSKSYAHLTQHPIIAAIVDNELQDLCRPLPYGCAVRFIDLSDPNGFRVYQRSVSMLMIYAAKTVLGRKTRVVVEHSINKNYYCELPELAEPPDEELLARIETVMRETAALCLPFEKHALPVEVARYEAEAVGLHDKVQLLKYRRTSFVNFYKLDWFYDYFYGQMAPDTGCLTHFKLTRRSAGFMLQFPTADNEMVEMSPNVKVSEVFEEASRWARILKADTVGSLNDMLTRVGSGEIVRVAEALHEKKISNIADQIVREGKSIVLIAGPSSSGKTTFAARLGIQLRADGKRPSVISLDNYYLNRDRIPRDEFGAPDFETVEALDNARISEDLNALLAGQTVDLPLFNFTTGKREPKGRPLKLEDGDVLILEGIHGLNERVSAGVSRADKFKIFISALTQLNIDDHNRIPTTDTRLVRRIVRDRQFRAYSAERTIDMWPSVQRGEARYIFPYQEEADAFFNSALVYEMCVLKQFVEPLLFGVPDAADAYTEAKRLIKFLDSFLGISSENVPSNSILREFVGGSCFA